MKKKVTLSIDESIYKDFQEFCEKNAIQLSKKVELVMEEIMREGKSIEEFKKKLKKRAGKK